MQVLATAAVIAAFAACGADMRPLTASPEPAPVPGNPVTISIVFGGDVMQHLPQIHAARRDTAYDFSGTFRYLKPFFDSADLAVVNLETTLSDKGPYSGYPLFSAPAQLATALRNAGVDAVALANNHTMDKGRRGVVSTLRALDDAGLRHTGVFADSAAYEAASPLIFDIKGVKVALLNYTYGFNGMPVPAGVIANSIDTVRMAVEIGKARDRADHTIVFLHWGYEYHRKPNAEQRLLAEWCHGQGVDFVIGSHPHVLQPLSAEPDSLRGIRRLTAYSLGNLVSNQRLRHQDGGMLLRLDITRRDSLPAHVRASYMLTWVYVTQQKGRREYIILPSPVADTMLSGDRAAKAAYDTFAADSRALLRDSLFREIRYRDPRAGGRVPISDWRNPVSRRE